MTEGHQGKDGIHHCRIDRCETFRSLQMFKHPVSCAAQGHFAAWFKRDAFLEFEGAIQCKESVAPTDLRTHLESRSRFGCIFEQLVQVCRRGYRPARLSGI